MEINSIGITNINHVKLGETLILAGAISAISGVIITRVASKWCSLSDLSDVDEILDIYKRNTEEIK